MNPALARLAGQLDDLGVLEGVQGVLEQCHAELWDVFGMARVRTVVRAREAVILELRRRRLTYRRIAQLLSCSPDTITRSIRRTRERGIA